MGNVCKKLHSMLPIAARVQRSGEAPPSKAKATPSLANGHGSASMKRRLSVENVLGKPLENVEDHYELGKELGRGQFGVTYLCTDKVTGREFACKTIAKRKLVNDVDIEDVRREVAIMHALLGHDNVVQVKGSYEDKHNVHIVMELCAGGELFDRIINKGHYSERAAAGVLRHIVGVVDFCHTKRVIHRDLKPENFLLSSQEEDSLVKATDFGLSTFFEPGDTFADIVGSAYYVAPEVLKRQYAKEADVWSCGVILYILLSGVPPFWAENDQGVFDAVLEGTIDFESDPWPQISPEAKELVTRMLTQDPAARISTKEVLEHPWVKEGGSASDKPLDPAVLTKLKQFSAMNKMKKLALKVIASNLSEEEIQGLKEMFISMDADGSGTITLDELREGLEKNFDHLPEEQVQQLMEAADADHSGTIDYQEFITATLQMNKVEKEEHLYYAFKHFDKDGSGTITVEELREALAQEDVLLPGEIDAILEDVDTDGNGTIDYSEFVAMMRRGNPGSEEPRQSRRTGMSTI